MTTEIANWEFLLSTLVDQSKRWWGIAVACQVLVIAISFLVVLTSIPAQLATLVAGGLTITYTLCQWRSDRLKRVSDSVKRKFEMHNGLGWPITSKELSDLLAAVSKDVREKAKQPLSQNYFSSKEPQSPRRLLQNLEESAWWTKHLAGSMARITATICAVVFAMAAIAMIIALQSAPTQTTAESVAKITITVIVFIFSGGYFRLAFEYYRFSGESEKIEERAHAFSEQQDIVEVEAIKLLHDYQITRAGSPVIPTWLWRIRQKGLNESWIVRTH
jgi:hypothetical protein